MRVIGGRARVSQLLVAGFELNVNSAKRPSYHSVVMSTASDRSGVVMSPASDSSGVVMNTASDRSGVVKASIHYASQQAATRLPRVFTPTLWLPPPIFVAAVDRQQHLTIFNMLKILTERPQALTVLCEWRETQCVAGHCRSRCYAIASTPLYVQLPRK